jgi:hypothetical protein
MALRLRTWTGVTVALCALVAADNLPPDDTVRFWRPQPTRHPLPEAQRFRALADEAARVRGLYRRLRLADTVVAHAVHRVGEGWSVEVRAGEATSDSIRDVLEHRFLREAATLPEPRPDGVVLGAWVVPFGLGSDAGTWDPAVQHQRSGREILLTARDGAGYCIGVEPGSARFADRAFTEPDPYGGRRSNVLGACWWVGAFGFPGPGIARWLAEGAALFGNESPATPRPAAAAWSYWGRWGLSKRRKGLFGQGLQAIEVDGCLAGRTEVCARLFREPTLLGFAARSRRAAAAEEARLHPGTLWIMWRDFSWLGTWGWMLADLHRDFGEQRFQAFWVSRADPETAFREAFGVPAGTWMASWMIRQSGHVPPGPLPSGRALLWALAVLGAAAAVSLGLAARRRAG